MSRQHVTDEADGKYFYIMLNMSDDDLDPYEHRLLGHYLRKKSCWETVATTAKITRMSVGKVVKTRNRLQELGYINIELSDHDTYLITVIDRMQENVARYEALARQKKASSRGEHQIHGMKNDLHEVKNRKFKVLHEVKQRITSLEEQKEEEQKEETTIAPAIANAGPVLSPNEEDVRYPFVEQRLSTSVPEGKTENSASAEKVTKAKSKAKDKDTTPLPPSAAPQESDKQRAQREKVDALVACGFPRPLSDRSWTHFNGILKTLTQVHITPDMYADFHEYVKGESARSTGWNVTLDSLVAKGRPEAYMAIQAKRAEDKRKQKEQEEKIFAKYPEARPPTGPVEYADPEEVKRLMDMVLNTRTRQENRL